MRLSEIIRVGNVPDINIVGVTDDSRRVERGYVFFTQSGRYSDRAYLAGACAVVCGVSAEVPKALPVPIIKVCDARSLYAEACHKMRGEPAKSMRLVAVTGTNGKTSVTMILKHIFDSYGFKTGVIGTTGNYIGSERIETDYTTPPPDVMAALMEKMRDAGVQYVFIEASSHALDQRRTDGLTFDVGIFTNLTRDHMDYHKSVDDYAAAKARLFSASRKSVIDLDDAHARQMAWNSAGEVIFFSEKDSAADYYAKDTEIGISNTSYTLCSDKNVRVRSRLTGNFYVGNTALSLIAANELGMDLNFGARALEDMPPVDGRMETVVSGNVSVLTDYAHTPDALENALKTLRPLTRGRLIAVFGCGGDRDRGKRAQMGAISAKYADITVITSDNPRTEDPDAIISEISAGVPSGYGAVKITDRAKAIRYALEAAKDGDVVLVAGKGHEKYIIDAGGKHYYSDKEQILEYYKRNG